MCFGAYVLAHACWYIHVGTCVIMSAIGVSVLAHVCRVHACVLVHVCMLECACVLTQACYGMHVCAFMCVGAFVSVRVCWCMHYGVCVLVCAC